MSKVYCVHSVRADEVRPTKFVCTELDSAERYAADMSTDPKVFAAAVTSFILDKPGTRRGVSLFVDGAKQAVPYISDDREINS